MNDNPQRSQIRKNEHIQICKTQMVESVGVNDWDRVELWPEALPECNFDDVNLEQTFLGKVFSMPVFITGMTGGVEHGKEINRVLAALAQKHNIPMGLGSQKMMFFDPKNISLFDVKSQNPDVFLMGNLGAVSLKGEITPRDVVEKLMKPLQVNAFAIHLNALQECIQPEGERDFSNLLVKIEELVKLSPVPIIVKEVGSGIAQSTFRRLLDVGVTSVDVGGRGGTSWSVIEGLRQYENAQRLGELFRNWGLTTKASLESCVALKTQIRSSVEITATGGIRNGLHVAKAVALGATMCGVGLPFFRAVVSPKENKTPLESVEEELLFFRDSLKISMFCCGSKVLNDLPLKLMKNT